MNGAGLKQNMRRILPYLVGVAVLFYAIPALSLLDAQAAESDLFLYILYIFNPAIVFVLGIVYAMRHGFIWYYPLLVGGLFIPAIPLFYNPTAIIYIFSYIVLGYVGLAVGYSIYRGRGHGG